MQLFLRALTYNGFTGRDSEFTPLKQYCVLFININQLDAQNLFYNKFISCLYMFRATCARNM